MVIKLAREFPNIKIVTVQKNVGIAKEISYGIEEEQIPYVLETVYDLDEKNIVEKAYEEATKSKLSIGIAICESKAIFHFSRLKVEEPLFVINNIEDTEKEELRVYGSNIARIVKGIPLKRTLLNSL